MGKYALFCQYFSLLMYYSLFILSCLSSHFDASIYILLISSSILLIVMVSDVVGVVCLVFVHGCSMSICSICYFVHVSMICFVVFKINYVGFISSYFFIFQSIISISCWLPTTKMIQQHIQIPNII